MFRRSIYLPSLGSKKSHVRNQYEADSMQRFEVLKGEATWPSVTPVGFQWSRRRHVQDRRTLQLCPLYLRIVWAAYAAVTPLLSITRLQNSVRQQLATWVFISVNWYERRVSHAESTVICCNIVLFTSILWFLAVFGYVSWCRRYAMVTSPQDIFRLIWSVFSNTITRLVTLHLCSRRQC